ncbi:MAG: DUF7373 family lipoprotein [Mycobacterium sp.]
MAAIGIWRFTSGDDTSTQASQTDSATSAGGDLSQLDVGKYDIEPRAFPGPPTEEEGRYLEAFRLAEGIALPFSVDAKIPYMYGFATPDPELAATTIAGTSTPIVAPIMEKYGMISAYNVQGYSKRLQEVVRAPEGDALIIMLSSFPNPDTAARAATEMEAADFAVSRENERIDIPGYPDAIAHYRPGWASVAATMASGRLVTTVVTSSSTLTNLDEFTARIQRTLDIQVPLMQNVIAGVDASLTSLPLDPAAMLTRTFTSGEPLAISATNGTIGPHAAGTCVNAQAVEGGVLEDAGVDRCSFTTESFLLRAADKESAAALVPALYEADAEEYFDHDLRAPEGVPGATCYEQKETIWTDSPTIRFACLLSFDRYTAAVYSGEENDVLQRAAAQYAILVNAA